MGALAELKYEVLSQSELREILEFLKPVSLEYPNFERWFVDKILPGLALNTRKIFKVRHGNQLVAIGIAKNENGEKKICTVRVASEFQRRGYGTGIVNEMKEWLDCEFPLISVSEGKLPQFKRIFDLLQFKLTSTRQGLYRDGKVEYYFNEKRSFS